MKKNEYVSPEMETVKLPEVNLLQSISPGGPETGGGDNETPDM